MKVFVRLSVCMVCMLCFFTLVVYSPPVAIAAKANPKAKPGAAAIQDKLGKPNARFESTKMSDMSRI